MYKQRLHVKIVLKNFLNSIKLFLLFSTEISSTEYLQVVSISTFFMILQFWHVQYRSLQVY
jgi:hypothetical protein